jgi:hypothetical protein
MNPESRTPFTHPCLACNGAGIYYDPTGPFDAVGETCSACSGSGVEESCRCGSDDFYFSRIEPMGYYCVNCGRPAL